MSILPWLQSRGLVHDLSHPEDLEKELNDSTISFYCGFDPTADSLHVGSMLPLIMMRRLQMKGHRPIILLGSGTGMIGDPSGKSQERVLLSDEAIEHNLKGIEAQARKFLSFEGDNAAIIVKNDEWLRPISIIDFLRDVGKHFSVNLMMGKDSVKSRLEDREQGISYTEFSYMLLQAFDFYWLYKEHNCQLQIGGSDQWGNITAGIDFIRRKTQNDSGQAFGLTFPLITTSSGTKFGKTESGNIWLSPERTSPYRFYQFWVNTQDADVMTYLKFFTDASDDELSAYEEELTSAPQKRSAQKFLAQALTDIVHGESETARSIQASKVLFGEKISNIDEQTLQDIFADVPSTEISREQISTGIPLVELLINSGLAKSKGEAKRSIDGGGIYINNEKVTDNAATVSNSHLATDSMLVLRSGKKKYHLIQVQG